MKLGKIRGEAFYHEIHESNPTKRNLERKGEEKRGKDQDQT